MILQICNRVPRTWMLSQIPNQQWTEAARSDSLLEHSTPDRQLQQKVNIECMFGNCSPRTNTMSWRQCTSLLGAGWVVRKTEKWLPLTAYSWNCTWYLESAKPVCSSMIKILIHSRSTLQSRGKPHDIFCIGANGMMCGVTTSRWNIWYGIPLIGVLIKDSDWGLLTSTPKGTYISSFRTCWFWSASTLAFTKA